MRFALVLFLMIGHAHADLRTNIRFEHWFANFSYKSHRCWVGAAAFKTEGRLRGEIWLLVDPVQDTISVKPNKHSNLLADAYLYLGAKYYPVNLYGDSGFVSSPDFFHQIVSSMLDDESILLVTKSNDKVLFLNSGFEEALQYVKRNCPWADSST